MAALYRDPRGLTVSVRDGKQMPEGYKPLKEAPKPPAKPKE